MASATRTDSEVYAGKTPRWLLALYGFLLLGFIVVGAAVGILLGYEYNLPRIQSLEDYHPDVITDIYSDDDKVIGEFAVERRIIINFQDIPPHLHLAILAAEDDQFYNHSGIDYFSVPRAAYKDIVKMSRAEGASTITQQLARLLMGNTEKTFDRKIKELLIAQKIERQYSKRQIFTLYCNQHYFGHGAYGIAAAADTYFGKPLKDLTLDECAMIAGLPRSPARYSPLLHPDAALARRNYVLDRMAGEGMISAAAAAEAKAKPLVLRQRPRSPELAPYFVEWVRQALSERYTTDDIWRKGLRVYTTLNADMQKAANRALREGLAKYDKRHGWRGPIDNILKNPYVILEDYTHPEWRQPFHPGDLVPGLVLSTGNRQAAVRIARYRATLGPKEIAWTGANSPDRLLKPGDLAYFQIISIDEAERKATVLLDQPPQVQGALVTMQNPTGEIKAMVGGYDFASSQFNRATQAMRQVGSTFKPIVYSTALEQGLEPDSEVVDAPVSYTDGLGRLYQPGNYDGEFKGKISLRQALAESRNVPTVKVASEIGIDNVLVMARRFGLGGAMEPYLPLALGAGDASPLEMASAFTVFPNLGFRSKPLYIRKIEDYNHVILEEFSHQAEPVLKPDIADKMLGMLQGVIQSGTAQAAKSLGRPLGGKTGTTNDFTDAWFVGFTPSLTTAVWIGFDSKKSLGNKEAGAVAALPIWIDYMKEILDGKPPESFPTVEITTDDSFSNDQQTPAEKKLFIENLPRTNPRKTP
jgi:penicillin-binding protein 1A